MSESAVLELPVAGARGSISATQLAEQRQRRWFRTSPARAQSLLDWFHEVGLVEHVARDQWALTARGRELTAELAWAAEDLVPLSTRTEGEAR